MASDTGSGHIRRNRPPRVQISYTDPIDAQKEVELPFVMGMMSDLSGNAPGKEKAPVEQREFEKVTNSTLDSYMKEKVQPGLAFMVDNKLDGGEGKMGLNLRFDSMEDFEPAQIARQVPALNELLEARKQLADLLLYMTSKPKAQEQIKELLNDPERLKVMAEQARAEAAAKAAEEESES
ncbi:type VI secretion protein, family [Tritonibacter multivorans]|uniref:Type VI secretion protein, family n=1 Tax=Tritonibacter multivorans TaxID=928856 RepID=A0A0P1GSI5_9RHOB|nr:type VI secretion system contractile sheath small subunit [Tritonibacter multivorans]MDA7422932.1 type VI secretion system contractile sheath small subunit [Tritonibacter multivorans]CUH78124.1 type VI secretion protein, family [Tritonibacter multivorans]SFD75193.1 type VI secretion system protein ImpB [Tritonibacter multivorans]